MSQDHLGFVVRYKAITSGVLIPKYYSPEVPDRLSRLRDSHDLISLGGLVRAGKLEVSAGHEIGKMAYGTGEIPFVRTSDISNWEIKTDPKQGVSSAIYAAFSQKQNVREGDIFFVRDGTYLIGQSCMVTRSDLPCIFQSHILRFRLSEQAPLGPYLLLALLNSPVVKLQIRARQFTADIIDTVGDRYHDILLPVPKEEERIKDITNATKYVVETRAKLRELIRRIPLWAQGAIGELDEPIPDTLGQTWPGEGNTGFLFPHAEVHNSILIPKYYDPDVHIQLRDLAQTHELVPISDLVRRKVLSWATGIEVGKMAYGTGAIPFIRTSDISNWELKRDPKQNVDGGLYEKYRSRQDVQPNDIFVVRGGQRWYLPGWHLLHSN